jgi:hypothetical protein
MESLPTYSVDLVNKLDQDYPDKCPDPKDSDREIWMKAGERRLVTRLLVLMNRRETESELPTVIPET